MQIIRELAREVQHNQSSSSTSSRPSTLSSSSSSSSSSSLSSPRAGSFNSRSAEDDDDEDPSGAVRLGEVPPFDFVEINGMKLTKPTQAYSLIWLALSGLTASAPTALKLLEKRFSTPSSSRRVCVLLVDEIDYVLTRNQDVIYNLFDWPGRRHARLVVIGIANTLDFPERLLPRVYSRLGLKRISFLPYSRQQLQRIVSDRLKGLELFDAMAVELCARKVASVSGDVRRSLAICRRAVELVDEEATALQEQFELQQKSLEKEREIEEKQKQKDEESKNNRKKKKRRSGRNRKQKEEDSDEDDDVDMTQAEEDKNKNNNKVQLETPPLIAAPKTIRVTMAHIERAIKQLFSSNNTAILQGLASVQKLFVVALFSLQRTRSEESIPLEHLADRVKQLCRTTIGKVSSEDVSGVCVALARLRLLHYRTGPGGHLALSGSVSLSIPSDDVIYALEKDDMCGKFMPD